MLGRTLKIWFIAAGLVAVLALAGCGEEKVETQTQPEVVPSVPEGNLTQKLEQLKKSEMTVEIVADGKSLGKWSQNDKGSWRLDDPADPGVYTIYNAEQMKGWRVTGKTATEMDQTTAQFFQATGPQAGLGIYAAFASMPRTAGDTDVWEWTNVPNLGSLRIEFKGPGGLISKIVSETPAAGKTELDFNYSNVGDVPDSFFELPADVQVQSGPSLPTMPTPTVPGGGGSTGSSSGY